jgi:hypothetical protein
MHDESPGGQASKERALAFWTDKRNFSTPVATPKRIKAPRTPKRLRREENTGLKIVGALMLFNQLNNTPEIYKGMQ